MIEAVENLVGVSTLNEHLHDELITVAREG
jgi:hypothetical protein